jgi:glycosyltransferase involved in cell wall biosynthesis
MRIAFLITGLESGGAEWQVVRLAQALHRLAWPVTVFALRLGPLAAGLREAGIAAERLSPSSLLRFRPQILHAHLYHANIAARLARLLFPIPVVISTVHSLAETSQRSSQIRYRDFAYRITNRLSDANVFVSRAVAGRHRAPRARVIPNAVDTDRFRPDPGRRARTRDALGLHQEFTWLAAGRLMWKKNYPLLLEAMAQRPESALFIAGEGPDGALLRGSAPANVRFLGARADLPGLMNAADGFALSSVIEGLPAVLLEAAASGLPCVATDVGGVAEAVAEGCTGYLVPSGDAAALYRAMSRLESLDAQERAGMSQAAREWAVARFDLRIVVEQWERLYRELLHEER